MMGTPDLLSRCINGDGRLEKCRPLPKLRPNLGPPFLLSSFCLAEELVRLGHEATLFASIDDRGEVNFPPQRAPAIESRRADSVNFRNEIAPLLGPRVEFIGEIDETTKAAFLGDLTSGALRARDD